MNKPLSKFKKYDTINESKKIIVNYQQIYTDITYTEGTLRSARKEKLEKELRNQIKRKERTGHKQVKIYGNMRSSKARIIQNV